MPTLRRPGDVLPWWNFSFWQRQHLPFGPWPLSRYVLCSELFVTWASLERPFLFFATDPGAPHELRR